MRGRIALQKDLVRNLEKPSAMLSPQLQESARVLALLFHCTFTQFQSTRVAMERVSMQRAQDQRQSPQAHPATRRKIAPSPIAPQPYLAAPATDRLVYAFLRSVEHHNYAALPAIRIAAILVQFCPLLGTPVVGEPKNVCNREPLPK